MTPLSQALGGLDESSSLPLYQQLQRALRQAIETRLLSPDDALPPERDLATEFAVSRITVRKAIDGLVHEGMLVRRQGSGTFVCARVEKNFSKLTSFSEDMRARGRNPRSVWLRKSAGNRNTGGISDVAVEPGHSRLSLSPYSFRRRCADGDRICDGARLVPCFGRCC